jgi:multisubunit Na+/H+ antiporter MnhB subunit
MLLVFLICMYINYKLTTYEGFDTLGNVLKGISVIMYVLIGIVIIWLGINSLYTKTSQNYNDL